MKRIVLVLAVAASPSLAVAQNASLGTAAALEIDAPLKSFTLSDTITERWYKAELLAASRSYCVEVIGGDAENNFVDPFLTVYADDGTTVIGSNDDAGTEPDLFNGSRVCFLGSQTPDSLYYVKVTSFITLVASRSFQVRMAETTLFSPWFQVATASGYDAAPQIKNNTNSTVNFVFLARAGTGTALAGCPTSTTAIPPNGTMLFGISSRCATASAFGGAQIAHDGPPGALSANITTFSAASGLSFDAPFTPRQDYH